MAETAPETTVGAPGPCTLRRFNPSEEHQTALRERAKVVAVVRDDSDQL